MQTRTYGELFKGISALVGTGGQLATGEQDILRHFINRRFQQAFDSSPIWPRYLVTSEERRIIALSVENAAGTNGSVANGDYYLLGSSKSTSSNTTPGTSIFYKTTSPDDGSLIDTADAIIFKTAGGRWNINTGATLSRAAGNVVDVSGVGTNRYSSADNEKKSFPYEVEYWNAGTGASGRPTIFQKQAIPYTENNRNNIGDFHRIHRKTPFINDSTAEYDFSVDINGANILNIPNTEDSSAYITYKREFTPYTITSGYYDSSLEVPGEFFNFIVHAVYADFLRVEGKQELAIGEEQAAMSYLMTELEKVDIISNNNTVNKRFSTHGTRQSR